MSDTILKVRNLDMHFGIGGGFFRKSTGVVKAVDQVSFDVIRVSSGLIVSPDN